MTLPKSFYIRTTKDQDPSNRGAHPLAYVLIRGNTAFVSACGIGDTFRKSVARAIVDGRVRTGECVVIKPTDTVESILRSAGVPRKVIKKADLIRADQAFERAIEIG